MKESDGIILIHTTKSFDKIQHLCFFLKKTALSSILERIDVLQILTLPAYGL